MTTKKNYNSIIIFHISIMIILDLEGAMAIPRATTELNLYISRHSIGIPGTCGQCIKFQFYFKLLM